MRRLLIHIPLSLLPLLTACQKHPPLETVANVQVNRYMGRWYEVARYPNSFETDCAPGTSTAKYRALPDGRVRVDNECICPCGRRKHSQGIARIVDKTSNAKLAVSFFWPFEGDYWVIDLDPDYRWAVVGEPSRQYLWILSRTPTLPPDVLDGIISRLPEKDYDTSRLVSFNDMKKAPILAGG